MAKGSKVFSWGNLLGVNIWGFLGWGCLFWGGPSNKDNNILGSTLGSPLFLETTISCTGYRGVIFAYSLPTTSTESSLFRLVINTQGKATPPRLGLAFRHASSKSGLKPLPGPRWKPQKRVLQRLRPDFRGTYMSCWQC